MTPSELKMEGKGRLALIDEIGFFHAELLETVSILAGRSVVLCDFEGLVIAFGKMETFELVLIATSNNAICTCLCAICESFQIPALIFCENQYPIDHFFDSRAINLNEVVCFSGKSKSDLAVEIIEKILTMLSREAIDRYDFFHRALATSCVIDEYKFIGDSHEVIFFNNRVSLQPLQFRLALIFLKTSES